MSKINKTAAQIEQAVSDVEKGKRKTYTQAQIDGTSPISTNPNVYLAPATFGVGSLERDDGSVFSSDGIEFKNTSSTVDVTSFGAVGDGVTDDTVAIQESITFAKTIATATKRITIKYPPGEYLFTGQLDFGAFLDIDMQGSTLISNGVVNESKVLIGTTGTLCEEGTFKELAIQNSWSFFGASGHKYNDQNLVGIEFINIQNCTIGIAKIQNFTTGLRLSADINSAYNIFFISSLKSCKTNINIHSLGPTGWVNENKFFAGDIQPTSNLSKFGSEYGIRYTSVAGGYKKHNNNVFFSPSFQLSLPTAYPTSSLVNELERYYDPATNLEYKVISAGEGQTTGTTAPTHTTGSALDSNGVNWEYVGKCRCSPVFHDDAGGSNRIYGARWEGGFGAFMIARGTSSTSAGSRTVDNVFEIKARQNVNLINDSEINESILDDNVSASAGNYLVTYSNQTLPTLSFTELHKKAVQSASGVTVGGFEHSSIYNQFSKYYAVDIEIVSEGLWIKSQADSIGLRINTNTLKRFDVSYGLASYATDNSRIRLKCYDNQNTQYTDLNTAGVARAWCSGANAIANEIQLPGPTTGKRSVGVHVDTKAVKVHFQGEVSTKTVINAITITANSANTSTSNNAILSTVNALPTNENLRYSYGTPIAGFFETQGEVINNLDTSVGQPLFWTVKTTGMLAKAWVTATAYKIGQIVEDSGNVYEVIVDHTSGSTFSGDSANFSLLDTVAILRASSEAY